MSKRLVLTFDDAYVGVSCVNSNTYDGPGSPCGHADTPFSALQDFVSSIECSSDQSINHMLEADETPCMDLSRALEASSPVSAIKALPLEGYFARELQTKLAEMALKIEELESI